MGIQINVEAVWGVMGMGVLAFIFGMWWHWREQKKKLR